MAQDRTRQPPPPRWVLQPQVEMEHVWEIWTHVVVQAPLWIHEHGGPRIQAYVTAIEQRDKSPECAQTPHLMETVYNQNWKARSPRLFPPDFLCDSE